MHHRTSWWAVLALGIAACADPQAPTSPASPDVESRPRFNHVAPSATNPRIIEGNISGNGAAVCAEVNTTHTPWLGSKTEGRGPSQVAGFQFIVSADGRTLTYSAIPGQQQGTIVAVVVKGGPDTHVYQPPVATGMISPLNGGSNVPQISHYTVCYTQAPAPWTVVKKLIQVYGGTAKDMIALGTGQPVVIPFGETRWFKFQIDVTGPAGGTATLQDLAANACAQIKPLGFNCYLPDEFLTDPVNGPHIEDYTYDGNPNVAGKQSIGPGSYIFWIDVTNDGACNAGGVITNTAQLTPTGGSAQQSTVQVQVQAGPCLSVEKKLLKVFRGTEAQMEEVPITQTLSLPKGEMRWLLFEITVSGLAGGTATLQDLAANACAQITPLGFNCYLPKNISGDGSLIDYTFDGNANLAGIQPIGPGKYQFLIDVIFEGNNCGVEGNLTNVAKLTPSAGGGALLSQAVVKVKGTCTTPS